jgi:Uma2 family endonuclease
MSLETSANVLDAVEHLPNGATLVIHELSWDDYDRLLRDLGDRPGLRISYDSGRLEVVSPTFRHEECQELIGDLVVIFCEVFHLTLQKAGGTTWRRRSVGKGAEADGSFYIRNAKYTVGKEDIDLAQDPPPDIVVEVDVTRRCEGKLPIYAALGIPEVWRYHHEVCKFYALAHGKYNEIPVSGFLPKLTAEMLTDAIEIGRSRNQDEARMAFRRRVKALKRK